MPQPNPEHGWWSATGSRTASRTPWATCVSCDAGACTIRTRQADVVIPLGLVVAAKQVPPAPERRRPRG
ncbi:hypothetical protein [Arthrobacter sp. SD76]|uniref:hypothetical protein n=1 Tax=Arthrobacter sp. SD76 TaxID=3415007 RepID=UPI003C72878F